MKKTILIFFVMILMSMSVFAQGQPSDVPDVAGNGEGNSIGERIRESLSGQKGLDLGNSVRVRQELLMTLESEQALKSINESIQRYRERVQQQNRTYESVEIKNVTDSNIVAEAKRQGRLLGFIPFSSTEEVVFDKDTGEEIERKEGFWHRFMRFE